MRSRVEGGRSLSSPSSNGLCLPPSAPSHSVSVIRMHRESLQLNIVLASFSTDETVTQCGLIEQLSRVATQIILVGCWESYLSSHQHCASEASEPISPFLVCCVNWCSMISEADWLLVGVFAAQSLINQVIVLLLWRDINESHDLSWSFFFFKSNGGKWRNTGKICNTSKAKLFSISRPLMHLWLKPIWFRVRWSLFSFFFLVSAMCCACDRNFTYDVQLRLN